MFGRFFFEILVLSIKFFYYIMVFDFGFDKFDVIFIKCQFQVIIVYQCFNDFIYQYICVFLVLRDDKQYFIIIYYFFVGVYYYNLVIIVIESNFYVCLQF